MQEKMLMISPATQNPSGIRAASRLVQVERKRGKFQDMAAEGLITFDELRARLEASRGERSLARRELDALLSRKKVAALERDAGELLESFTTAVR